ncbi:MAG TPA: tRNA (adenosine(37)-N6)-dimethylallyltransferase MiaA [Candidatus Saccharimonadales bacterium]|nr:tRNA (adenosine(37)-N6)-dimethylallyltransferase MiaA [Candidatus Saccharimonadales bacterium]
MQKLLVICGPTGTGKTDLALTLAKKFDGELVSADSRQVYTGMDIGTGKGARPKGGWVVNGTPIHLYDIRKPNEKFSLAEYQQLALEKINEIHSTGKLPILVGGTGLYIQAVTEGLNIPKFPPDQKLRGKLESRELPDLLSELEKVDPDYFEAVDKNNKRRVVRALEVFHQSGEPFSKLRSKYKVDFDILKVGLTSDREELYSRNDKRVEQWFEEGFVEEVKKLLKDYSPNLPAMTSLGYRQVAAYIKGSLGSEEAKQRIKFDYHGYIRRQLTWFKRDSSIYWYEIKSDNLVEDTEDLVAEWLKK